MFNQYYFIIFKTMHISNITMEEIGINQRKKGITLFHFYSQRKTSH